MPEQGFFNNCPNSLFALLIIRKKKTVNNDDWVWVFFLVFITVVIISEGL